MSLSIVNTNEINKAPPGDFSPDERNTGLTFALDNVGFIDFESRSRTDIKAGTYRYAADADANVICYAIGTGQVVTISFGSFGSPLEWDQMPVVFREFHARVQQGKAHWAAWNAAFDKAIWNRATRGFPPLLAYHIIDVMVQAVASGLPPDLSSAAIASASSRKDKSGGKLIQLFCVPGAIGSPVSHHVEWQQFLQYARKDIEALRSVFTGTGSFRWRSGVSTGRWST